MTRKAKLISFSGKEWRKSDPLPSILEEWYGNEAGSSEIISHLPDVIPLQDAIKSALTGTDSSNNVLLSKIRAEWANIVGKDISSISSPKSIKNCILHVCVENSAWMMELRSYSKKFIVDRLCDIYGKNSIKDIIFILSG